MKITLVIDDLNGGGAERVMAQMANYWAAKSWDITLITTNQQGLAPFYRLDERVRHVDLDPYRISNRVSRTRGLSRLGPLAHHLTYQGIIRSAIVRSKPQVVLSFLDELNTMVLMSLRGSGIPVVVSERINPFCHVMTKEWEELRHKFYRIAAKVVVQTEAGVKYFRPEVQQNSVIIPNAIVVPPDSNDSKPPPFVPGRRYVVGMGRLDTQKGFDLLIDAYSAIAPEHPEWDLVIFGEGSERKTLAERIEKAEMTNRIFLPGKTGRSADAMRRCDIFVLSSRFEGFPNVLGEAMACGCAVVSYDCPTGPSEIITDGVDGLLVPVGDVDKLAEAISVVIKDPKLRSELSSKAPRVMERFSPEAVMAQWEQLLMAVAKR